jgi:hypothetical protein
VAETSRDHDLKETADQGARTMAKTWLLTEFQKFQELIDVLGLQIRTLEMENNRLRRRLIELRKKEAGTALLASQKPIKM